MNVDLYEHLLLSFIVACSPEQYNEKSADGERTATRSRVVRLQQGASRQGSDVLRAAVGEWKAAR